MKIPFGQPGCDRCLYKQRLWEEQGMAGPRPDAEEEDDSGE